MKCRMLTLLLLLLTVLPLACASDDDDDHDSDSEPTPDDDDDDNDDDNDNDDNDTGDDDDDDNDDNDDNDNDNDNDDDNDDASPSYFPLYDEAGRELILHGANFMAVEAAGLPIDYERMRDDWGFNVVRILITWSALEPEQGVYNYDYLPTLVDPQIQYAADAGVKVILDMHQYHWSSCCGGMGMPDWTCSDLGEVPFEWLLQSGPFWSNEAYLDAFVALWEYVAEYYAGDDRIIAYDLFNEPIAGLRTLPWTMDNQLLRPLYERLIAGIRAVDPEHYLMIEPAMISVAGFPCVMDRIEADKLIYAPHLYPGMIAEGGDYDYPRAWIEKHLGKRVAETARFRTPLLIGETGLKSSGAHAEQYARDSMEILDQPMAHWTWWAYGYDDDSMGLCLLSGEPKEIFLRHLSRPYPRATAGHLGGYDFDVDTLTFTLNFTNDEKAAPETEIFVNAAYHYPDGFTVSSTDPESGWSYAWDADAQLLTVTADPATAAHTITIAPQ